METTTKKNFDWCYDKKLSEHKYFEAQLSCWELSNWVDFQFKWSRKGDHAGISLTIEIWNWYFCAQIYDHRHWNFEQDRFYFPGEEWDELVKLEEQIGNRNFCGNSKFTIVDNTKL